MAFKIFSNLKMSNSSGREAQFGRNQFQKEQKSVCVKLDHLHTQKADYSLAFFSH